MRRSSPRPVLLIALTALWLGLMLPRAGVCQVAGALESQEDTRTSSFDDPLTRSETNPNSSEGTDTIDRIPRGRSLSRQTEDGVVARNAALTTSQIITLIHDRPEVAVDVKRVMADFFLKRGIAVQEDSITDEILFSNVASNASLRRTVSIWLRARGYVDDAESSEWERMQQSIDPTAQSSELTPRDMSMQKSARESLRGRLDLPEDSELIPDDIFPLMPQQGDNPLYKDTLRMPDETATSPRPNEARSPAEKTPTPAKQAELLHRSAPYNLQSLRDLYTQLPEQTAKITPFGAGLFTPRGSATRQSPIDLPIGPDYILGPGDTITITLWGGVAQSFNRVVDPHGSVILPDAGPTQVAGLTLERAEGLIQRELARQYHNARVMVSVARLRTVRIYVVGDVLRPGAYDISSLSTPLNALYAAGGPTPTGSLRSIRQMRGKTVIREVDLYDFFRNGVNLQTERLQSGDTILVPPVGATAHVTGMVKRPAIYEFRLPCTLAQIIEEAGGLTPEAAVTHIRIERIDPAGHRATTEIELPSGSTAASAHQQMESFAIEDGDHIVVAPVLPYSERIIYTTGHFARPGRLPFRDAMTLRDVVRSYSDLLPEPASVGEIIRLMPPDLHPEAIQFRISEVLNGSVQIRLQPFDTILVRGRYEADAPRVTIRGEVLKPGSYALTETMTAAQLVRIAGGFKRSALLTDADLTSYTVRDGTHVESQHRTIAIGQAVSHADSADDAPLLPGDVLTIHQISGWNDIGSSVTLTGEVVYPGTYGLQDGETLSSVIRRAGGFRSTAYPEGAVMVRQQVKQLELKSRAELIRQIETTSAGTRSGSNGGNQDESNALPLLVQQQNQMLQRLRSEPVIGRLVIAIGSDIAQWERTPADIQLRAGDVVTIPKRPGFVMVTGQAYNNSAITFAPGKDAGWYLRHAGGPTSLANRKEIFVIRANGLVVGRRSGDWHQSVLSTRMHPGDVVVVPQKIVGGSAVWKNTLAAAQVVSSIAFTAALTLR